VRLLGTERSLRRVDCALQLLENTLKNINKDNL
jgi:hypothetical protein